MKREEPSVNSPRGNPSAQVDLHCSGGVGSETTGSLSQPGRTVTARTEQPALSWLLGDSMAAVVDDSNIDAARRTALGIPTQNLCRTAVCGAACTVVWGPRSAMAAATRFVHAALPIRLALRDDVRRFVWRCSQSTKT
jgi:hypothetical protein